jgi:dolichol-phosphate mannosyltransferase
MSYVGFAVAALGFFYALFLISRYLVIGSPAEGWTSLMVVMVIVSGLQMVMMGVLGEYLWRALDESRRRPAYLIEARTDNVGAAAAQSSSKASL